jgi:hypothetical protein
MEPCPNCKSTDRIEIEIRQSHKHGKKDCKRGLSCTQKALFCKNCRIAR